MTTTVIASSGSVGTMVDTVVDPVTPVEVIRRVTRPLPPRVPLGSLGSTVAVARVVGPVIPRELSKGTCELAAEAPGEAACAPVFGIPGADDDGTACEAAAAGEDTA